MKTMTFAGRNTKEMVRDPLTVAFGIGFPVVLLLLLTAIQSNIPVEMFVLNQLTPGIACFGLSFVSLFSATLISKDRSSSFLMRLYASPMKPSEFLTGYVLPLIPMSIAQALFCYIIAMVLGLEYTPNIFISILVMVPVIIMYIAIGLLCGTCLSDKQVGGICGALLTNLTAWLSGTWFDLNLVGGTFKKIADLLPFSHSVEACRAALNGNFEDIMPDLLWVIGYAVVIFILAALVFSKKMRSDAK